jgi:hypothetical protein
VLDRSRGVRQLKVQARHLRTRRQGPTLQRRSSDFLGARARHSLLWEKSTLVGRRPRRRRLRLKISRSTANEAGCALPQVRDALTFSIGPTAKGSLIVPLVAGGGDKGPQLASDAIAQAFWKETGLELGRVAKAQAARLSATGAEAFARAGAAAKDSSAKLSFATKTGRGTWRAVATITPLEAALRKHAASQRKGHRATTSISGQIVSLRYDPPGFILATSTARRSVRMPSSLRDRARELWGREVVILTDAAVAADGGVADLQAIDIRPLRPLRRQTRASTKPLASCVVLGTVPQSVGRPSSTRTSRPAQVRG